MQLVRLCPDDRRLTQRREAVATLAFEERRITERRQDFERRQHFQWSVSWLRARLSALTTNAAQVHIPLWLLLSIFVLTLLSLNQNFATSSQDALYGQSRHEIGEVIVFNASDDFSANVTRSGYTLIEAMNLQGLKIKVQRLKIPAGMSVPEALNDLRYRYPDLDVEANTRVLISDPS